jgi:hypothetical protein
VGVATGGTDTQALRAAPYHVLTDPSDVDGVVALLAYASQKVSAYPRSVEGDIDEDHRTPSNRSHNA